MSATKIDTGVGTVATAIGSAGVTTQLATEVLSLTVVVVNLVLALGGMYLLYRRLKKMHQGEQRRRGD